MQDEALEKFIMKIDRKYGDMLTEMEISEVLGFTYPSFRNLRLENPIIPFLRIGKKVFYLKDDLILYLKSKRRFSNVDSNR